MACSCLLNNAQLIAANLSNNDRIQCLMVNRAWNASFLPILYHDIFITSRKQRRLLFKRLGDSEKKDSVGLLIRHLRFIDNVGLSRDEFELLPKLCPLLEIIVFTPSVWQHLRCAKILTRWKNVHTLPTLSRKKLASYCLGVLGDQLRDLSFDGQLVEKLHQRDEFVPMLSKVHWLTSLNFGGNPSLNSYLNTLCFDLKAINAIHKHCPFLQNMTLSWLVLSTGTSSQPNTLVGIRPAPKMRMLKLQHIQLNDPHWLHIIAHKYPNLVSLELHNVNWTENVHELTAKRIKDYHNAYLAIARNLKQLKVLKLTRLEPRLWPSQLFLQAIRESGTMLHTIEILPRHNYTTTTLASPDAFQEMINTFPPNARSISFKTCVYDVFPSDMIKQLETQCAFITELNLSGSEVSEIHLPVISLEQLLDGFPKLQSLRLEHYDLEAQNKRGLLVDKHRLKTFHLAKVWLTNDHVFSYLSVRCPQLSDMSLDDCTWRTNKPSMDIKVDMPYHTFHKFGVRSMHIAHHIEGIWARLEEGAIFSITEVKRNKRILERKGPKAGKNGWYRIGSGMIRWYHLYQFEDGLRLRRLGLGEIDMVKDYRMNVADFEKMFEHDSMPSRDCYNPVDFWQDDIPCGYFTFRCHSIDMFIYDFVVL
ncbi:hypothetical protein CLU79DRAFT_747330 [Phycomyces nitens]|nr:hypothetical protein CLU79DRAFT_747330 [Phycomyces nitens]